MTHANDHDVIVLGAGPAGSTVSALLAEMGYRVLVVENVDDTPVVLVADLIAGRAVGEKVEPAPVQ